MATANRNTVYFLSILALGLATYFAGASITIHIVNTNLVFSHDTLSYYVLGTHGWALEAGFYAIGLNQLILAWLLYTQTRIRLLSMLLLLAACGAFLVGFFPVQAETADTIKRLPHISGAISQFLFFPLATFLASRYIHEPTVRAYTLLTAYVTGVFFIILLILFLTPSLKSFVYFGLLEKIDISFITAWLITMPVLFILSRNITAVFNTTHND